MIMLGWNGVIVCIIYVTNWLIMLGLVTGTGGDSNMSGNIAAAAGPKRRSNMGNISPADLASFFECPVCFDYVLPPIYQCQAGHLVCSVCRPKLNCCPTCRGPLGMLVF